MEKESNRKRMVSAIIGVFAIALLAAVMFLYSSNKKDYVSQIDKKYRPVGASVALIESDGSITFENFGYANKKEKTKVTEDTKFKMASISKTVTSYAVMQLVDNGTLDLDTPVNNYLTSWKIPDSKEYDVDKVTLRTLMSHTAGLSKSDEVGYKEPLPSVAEAMGMRDIHLIREPGTEFEYSEFVAHGVCQLVIEDVTGMKFEDYMKQNVFEPLGMYDTSYDNKGNNFAIPYAGYGKEVSITPIVMNGGGGVTTTAKDLSKFAKELIRYKNEGNDEMFEIQKNTQSAAGEYALGIIPRKLSNGKTVYEHNGTLTGWNAQLVISPEDNTGMVVLANSDQAYYMTYELMEKWGEHVVGAPIEDPLISGINQAFCRISIILGVLVFAYIIYFSIQLKKNRLERIDNRKWKIRLGISIAGVSLYLFFFYTEIPFLWMYGQKNNYLYTFFPSGRIWLYLEMILFLVVWVMKGHYYRNKIKKTA